MEELCSGKEPDNESDLWSVEDEEVYIHSSYSSILTQTYKGADPEMFKDDS